jgi:hypothetical protein
MACSTGEASTAPAVQTAFARNLLRLSVELSECAMKHLYPAKSPDAGPLRPEYQIAAFPTGKTYFVKYLLEIKAI